MECNKDEASRAKSIAESKLVKKDFSGAKKFALKAQTLYPGLHGISHMLTTIDVYLAAENKPSGEVDWYGVLAVSPSADDDTIKKQYRKLALLLHPDKNNSVGADGAFKLISEAWKLLADKEKRAAYNQRRSRGFHQKVTTNPGGPSAPYRPHQHSASVYNGGQSVPPRPSEASAAARPTQKKVPRPTQQNRSGNEKMSGLRSDTFWTHCNGCSIYFEYLKKYWKQTLLCQICKKPFLALATALPISPARAVPWLGLKNSLKYLASLNGYDPKKNVTYVRSTAGNVGQHDNLKRSDSESRASGGLEGCYKKVKLDDDGRCGVNSQCMADGNGDFGTGVYGCS